MSRNILEGFEHPQFKINVWKVIELAVETGTTLGIARAHKHGEPSRDLLEESIVREIMNELSEWTL